MEWKKFDILRLESWETGFLFLNCFSLSLSLSHTHTHIWAVQDNLVIWRLGGKGPKDGILKHVLQMGGNF